MGAARAGAGIERIFRPALAGRRPAVADRLQQAAAELRGFDVPGWLEAWSAVFSPADKRALDTEAAGFLLGNMQEALRAGLDGWIDDEIAFAQPWGVELAAVRQAAAIWHGDEDRMTTPADARLLAAVRQAAAIWHGDEHRMTTPADARLLAAGILDAELFMVEATDTHR